MLPVGRHVFVYRGLAACLVLSATGIAAAGVGCAHLDSGEGHQALTTRTNVTFWTTFGNELPLCFVTSQQFAGPRPDAGVVTLNDPKYRDAFQCAVERTWSATSNVTVTGFKSCPTSGSDRFVRYVINTPDPQSDSAGAALVGRVDNANFVLPSAPFDPSFMQGVVRDPLQLDPPFQAVVVHEVGHTLGFEHEIENPNNRYADGGILRWPDGGAQWCESVPLIPLSVANGLTPTDPKSAMISGYCHNDELGSTSLDITGVRSVYGARPETADSDKDGTPDFEDNCPYVRNPLQTDSNRDAALTKSVELGYTGTVNGPEGHRPVLADPPSYKERWHASYAGDACDTTAVTAVAPSGTTSNLDFDPCTIIVLGSPSSISVDPSEYCGASLDHGRLEFDSYISTQTGLSPIALGTGRPAFCRCDVADDANPAVRAECQSFTQEWKCFYADDDLFPLSMDNNSYRRITREAKGISFTYPQIHDIVQENFVAPSPCFSPDTKQTTWNPFTRGSTRMSRASVWARALSA